MLLDVWLQGSKLDGLQLLEQIKRRDASLPVLMISGHGNLDTAVAAIREGAVDFIEKPFKADRLLHLVGRATETDRLKREVANLRHQLGPDDQLDGTSVANGTVVDGAEPLGTVAVGALVVDGTVAAGTVGCATGSAAAAWDALPRTTVVCVEPRSCEGASWIVIAATTPISAATPSTANAHLFERASRTSIACGLSRCACDETTMPKRSDPRA